MKNEPKQSLWKMIFFEFEKLLQNKDILTIGLENCQAKIINQKLIISGADLNIIVIKENLALLQKAIDQTLGKNYQIDFAVNQKKPIINYQNEFVKELEQTRVVFSNHQNEIPNAIKNLTFDNLIIHNNNQKAVKMLSHFIESNHNVCYLFGNPGTGKTHLAGAILNKYQQLYPQKRCYYLDSVKLINDYNELIFKKEIDPDLFAIKYTKYDFLIVDDLHKFNKKDKINSKLFTIIDYLLKKEAKILFIDLLENQEMKNVDHSLKSRIQSGFRAKIEDIEAESMCSILVDYLNKEDSNLKVAPDALDYLVSILPSDVRSTFSFITNLIFLIKEDQDALTIVSKEKIIKIAEEIGLKKIVLQKINEYPEQNKTKIIDLCKKINFDYKFIVLNKSRKREIVEKRNILIYFLKECFDYTHETIAQMFNKHHSTITNSLKNIKRQLKNNHEFKRYLDQLKNLVN